MHRKKILIIVAIMCGVALIIAGCSSTRVLERYAGEKAKNMLFNRPWLDEYPQKPDQRFMAYVYSDEGIGVHDKADSAFLHLLEIFTFRATAEKLFFIFPHDNRKAETAYKVEKISGHPPFNLRLSISQDPKSGGKSYTYFSNTDWEITDSSTLPPELRTWSKHLN